MPRAGQFRDRIMIQRQTDAGGLDDYGNPNSPSWGDLSPFWADLRESTGKERLAAGRLEAPATATLRLRASPDAAAILPADRVLARNATWKILGGPTDPNGRGQLVEFLIERGGAVE